MVSVSCGNSERVVNEVNEITSLCTSYTDDTNLAFVCELAGIRLLKDADTAPIHILVPGVPGRNGQSISRGLERGGGRGGYEKTGQ